MAARENHQFAGDARSMFSFGGQGDGRIAITTNWPAADLTAANIQKLFRFQRTGRVGNFTIYADGEMDSHATPTLTWQVGVDGTDTATTTDPNKYMSAVTDAEAVAGHGTNELAETTEAGSRVIAGDYITLGTLAAAATGVAGNVTIAFTFFPEDV